MRELDDAALERRLRGVLQEHLGALPLDLTVETLDRRREARGVIRRVGRGRGMTLLAAAALLGGGALAAGSGILRLPTVVPPVPEPSVIAVATASPDTTSPSPSPTATAPPGPSDCVVPSSDPSEPVGPVAWTPESLNEDWPAPARAEAADGSVLPMPPTYRDPTGDTGSDGFPCVDIRWLMADTSDVHLKLVSKPPPWSCSETRECFGVDPTEQWIAYGVVTDEDGDGVPDWRYGIDNMPAEASGDWLPMRGWRTNLHTGQTEAGPYEGDPPWARLGGDFQAGLPTDSADWEPDAEFRFNGSIETTQGSQRWGFELDMPFYTWASVIVNGRVAATDYAPDAGWLVATPGVALIPNSFPGGPYLLEVEYDNTDSALSRPLRASMTVPRGWTVGGPWGESDRGNTSVDFTVVGHPWDGCPDTVEPTLGPSFDDLVSYLEALPRIEISEIRYGTLDGHRTAYLEYRPADGHFDCFSGSPIPLEPGNNDAWIVDVDGVRLVITAWSDEAPSEAVRSEVRQIVESIRIVGVPPSLPASPSPTPSPTPTPTPFAPEAGPVPPNARTWKVTVDNQSSEPAALFVAEGDEGGTFRLVGSATPNVVPARTTVKVTFQLPAEGDPDAGWIYVNPGPDSGGLFPSTDLPPAGKILIMADGQGGWLSP